MSERERDVFQNEENNVINNDVFGSSQELDLGSEPLQEFDPFGDSDFAMESTAPISTPQTKQESKPNQTNNRQSKSQSTSETNPLQNAISLSEIKETQEHQKSLFEKPPVFDYASATETIEDITKTFEELRIEKSEDFPELEDGKRVSWTVEYGKITKLVSNPKEITISKIKSELETSKEFLDGLKKAKDKNPVCKLKPKVTAQSKGKVCSYKGVFTSVEEAIESSKMISIIPAKDGKIYEMRKNELGTFITPIQQSELLSEIEPGFTPALPLIPHSTLSDIVSFFRFLMEDGKELEALLNIYWDKQEQQFIVDAPRQVVSKVSVESNLDDHFTDDRYLHYMDIHSHNSMKAFFSPIDDKDEQATRLYAVVGQLNEFFPMIRVRISNGGKHLEINPSQVFELNKSEFPTHWAETIQPKKTRKYQAKSPEEILQCIKNLKNMDGDLKCVFQ